MTKARKLYTVNDLTWEITSEEILRVEEQDFKSGYIIYTDRMPSVGIEISNDIFKFFREKFPEHCINITKDSRITVPF